MAGHKLKADKRKEDGKKRGKNKQLKLSRLSSKRRRIMKIMKTLMMIMMMREMVIIMPS